MEQTIMHERLDRIEAAKESGKSLTLIAKEEGISRSRVQQLLFKAARRKENFLGFATATTAFERRIINSLIRAKVDSIEQLKEMTYVQLMGVNGLGVKSIELLEQWLNYTFDRTVPEKPKPDPDAAWKRKRFKQC